MYYYDKINNVFYNSDIHNKKDIPIEAIEVSEEKYKEMINKIYEGCVILDDLTYSPMPPSEYYTWKNNNWELDIEKLNFDLQNSFEDEKTSLLEEATMELSILEDLKEIEEDKEILDLYKEWKQYRLDVYKTKYKLRPFVSYRRPQPKTLLDEDDFIFPPKPKKYNED